MKRKFFVRYILIYDSKNYRNLLNDMCMCEGKMEKLKQLDAIQNEDDKL